MRRIDRIVFAVTAVVLAAVAVTASVLVIGHQTRCERFEPRWNTLRTELAPERNRFARLVAKCGSLDGLERAEVRRRLGRGGGPRARVWSYDAGNSDTQFLTYAVLEVVFSPAGDVRDARVKNFPINSG